MYFYVEGVAVEWILHKQCVWYMYCIVWFMWYTYVNCCCDMCDVCNEGAAGECFLLYQFSHFGLLQVSVASVM